MGCQSETRCKIHLYSRVDRELKVMEEQAIAEAVSVVSTRAAMNLGAVSKSNVVQGLSYLARAW